FGRVGGAAGGVRTDEVVEPVVAALGHQVRDELELLLGDLLSHGVRVSCFVGFWGFDLPGGLAALRSIVYPTGNPRVWAGRRGIGPHLGTLLTRPYRDLAGHPGICPAHSTRQQGVAGSNPVNPTDSRG
ncbi:hypothetical protein PIB30_107223, partial [Stylosanthes scabra]|nr:hypothetical protein [Stylosanthes scabra]